MRSEELYSEKLYKEMSESQVIIDDLVKIVVNYVCFSAFTPWPSYNEKLYKVVSESQVMADVLVDIVVNYCFSAFTSLTSKKEKDEYIRILLSRSDWDEEIKCQDEGSGAEIDAIADHLAGNHIALETLTYYGNVNNSLRKMRQFSLLDSQIFPKKDINYSEYQLNIPGQPKLEKNQLQIDKFKEKLFTNENFVARVTLDATFIKSGPFCYGLDIGLDFKPKKNNLGYRILCLLNENKEVIPLLQICGYGDPFDKDHYDVANLLDCFIPFHMNKYSIITPAMVNSRRQRQFIKMLKVSPVIGLSDNLRKQLATMSSSRFYTQQSLTGLNDLLCKFAIAANNFVKSYCGVEFEVVYALQQPHGFQKKDESQPHLNQARFSFSSTRDSSSSSKDSTCLVM